MNVDTLRAALNELAQVTNEQWLQSLSPRKISELEFHNKIRRPDFVASSLPQDTYEKFFGNKKYYAATYRSKAYMRQWVREKVPGKVFLDYACGNGEMALLAAKAGAALAIGLDISDLSVANAKRAAENEELTANTYFVQGDAENTGLPDQSIDVVICSGMLHHLDLSFAFPELRRIVKPGGCILAAEALDYNPLIKLYRAMTPAMRTEWEKAHILGLGDIAFARRFFAVEKLRYWHVVGYAGGKFPILLPALDALDRVLEKLPLIQLMAWMFTFELKRPPGEPPKPASQPAP